MALYLSNQARLPRRQCFKALAATAGAAAVSASGVFTSGVVETARGHEPTPDALPPVRTITKGPARHWFGYYDKQQFDVANRYVLSNEVVFEHRTPTAEDIVRIGMIDTHDGDRWIPLGTSNAWGWQQGCMLQWRPLGTTSAHAGQEIVWNDRQNDQHVCRVFNVKTREMRTLPRPIYALSSDGRSAITADFARIQRMRPGYGYVGLEDPCRSELAPESSGVWKMDLDTGVSDLIFSLADAAKIAHRGKSLDDKWHYFNHLLVSPNGKRFIVLHRWRESVGEGASAEPAGPFTTRMFTVNMDGSERYILDPSGYTSHFIWRDDAHICAWTRPEGRRDAFYLFRDQSDKFEIVGEGVMILNGHNTYLPDTDNEWILNDTYPSRTTRLQNPYLYHVPSDRRVSLGQFHSPPEYVGEWRCDTHPRSSNDGRSVCIDSPHTGDGRQLHLIDIRNIIDG